MAAAFGILVVALAVVGLWWARRLAARDERPSVEGYQHGLEVLADVAARAPHEPVEAHTPDQEVEGPTGNVRILSNEEFAALPAAVRRRASQPPRLRRRSRGGRGRTAGGVRSGPRASRVPNRAARRGDRAGDEAVIHISTLHEDHVTGPPLEPLPVEEGSDGGTGSGDAVTIIVPASGPAGSNVHHSHSHSHNEAPTPAPEPTTTADERGPAQVTSPALGGDVPPLAPPAHDLEPPKFTGTSVGRSAGRGRRSRRRRLAGPPLSGSALHLPSPRTGRERRTPRTRHHGRSVVAAAAAGILVLGVGALVAFHGSSRTSSPHLTTPSHAASARPAAPATTAAPEPLHVVPAADQPATFTVAVGGPTTALSLGVTAPCWVMVRSGGANGHIIASQMVDPGQSLHLASVATPVWVRLGAPWNAQLSAGGRSIALPSSSTPIDVELQSTVPTGSQGGTSHGAVTAAAATAGRPAT